MCERKNEHCAACEGSGTFELTGCPYQFVTPDVWEVVEAAELVEKTGWPRGGGWANEPAAMVDGVQRVWLELAKIKHEAMKAK